MKITRLESSGERMAVAGQAGAAMCVLRLHAGKGFVGTAPCPSDLVDTAQLLAARFLLGEDPHAQHALGQRLLDACRARRGHGLQAAAALDIALWDLKAHILGEPLWRLAGGATPRCVVLAGAPPGPAAGQPLEWYERQVREHGVSGARLRLAGDMQADAQRAQRLCQLLAGAGDEPTLVVEAVAGWQPKEAVRRLHSLQQHVDVARVEWHAGSGDPATWRTVSRSVRAAVCVPAGFDGADGLQSLMRDRAADVIGLDAAWLGITGLLQLADAAFGFELPVVLAGSPGNLHVHLAGALPTCAGVEMRDPRSEPALRSGIRFSAGRGHADERPGHGIAFWPGTDTAS